MTLDNLRVHHSKLVKAWVAGHQDEIELFHLPSHSPQLNPEERLNADLKQAIIDDLLSHKQGCVWLPSVFTFAVHSNVQAQRLTFEIAGLASNNGAVDCLLFSSPEGFPGEARRAIKQRAVPLEEPRATCEFAKIPVGTHALSIWHDANANRRLDANLIGVPKEPVGASNNAEGRMGPPGFEAAVFKVVAPVFLQRVNVR